MGHGLHTFDQAAAFKPTISPYMSRPTLQRLGLGLAIGATGVFLFGKYIKDHMQGTHAPKKYEGNLGMKVHGPVKYASKHENKYNMKDDTLANLNKMADKYYEQPGVKRAM